MGYDFARELRAKLPEELALRCHLIYNHFPRVSLEFLPIAQEALRLAREGDFATTLELPNGTRLPVAQIIADLHLEAFLDGVPS